MAAEQHKPQETGQLPFHRPYIIKLGLDSSTSETLPHLTSPALSLQKRVRKILPSSASLVTFETLLIIYFLISAASTNKTVSSVTTTTGSAGTGDFSFELGLYTDDTFATPIEASDVIIVGERVNFAVSSPSLPSLGQKSIEKDPFFIQNIG